MYLISKWSNIERGLKGKQLGMKTGYEMERDGERWREMRRNGERRGEVGEVGEVERG